MRRVATALLAVVVAWLATWFATAVALKLFTGSASQALDLWCVGFPTLVLLAASWMPRAAETTLAAVGAVLVVFLFLVLLLDGTGYALAAALTLGVPGLLIFGTVGGMVATHGRQAFRWRWLTRRRIDVFLHYRHES